MNIDYHEQVWEDDARKAAAAMATATQKDCIITDAFWLAGPLENALPRIGFEIIEHDLLYRRSA
jgi:hypothetical protein